MNIDFDNDDQGNNKKNIIIVKLVYNYYILINN